MKAAIRSSSKGSKRRGRPLKQDAARTDSGQISRAANPSPSAFVEARNTRMRLYGVSKQDAGDPVVNSVIGRLLLAGAISDDQYTALDRFVCAHKTYMKAIQAPDSLSAPGAGSKSGDEEADTAWRITAERSYKAARQAIRDAQERNNGNLYAAIDFLGFRDELHAHMVGDLRLVGNALIRHYGLTRAA